jgi:hypothetical protein
VLAYFKASFRENGESRRSGAKSLALAPEMGNLDPALLRSDELKDFCAAIRQAARASLGKLIHLEWLLMRL